MTDVYVYFTSAFINKFCTEYHAGKTAEAILRENNIDPVRAFTADTTIVFN